MRSRQFSSEIQNTVEFQVKISPVRTDFLSAHPKAVSGWIFCFSLSSTNKEARHNLQTGLPLSAHRHRRSSSPPRLYYKSGKTNFLSQSQFTKRKTVSPFFGNTVTFYLYNNLQRKCAGKYNLFIISHVAHQSSDFDLYFPIS